MAALTEPQRDRFQRHVGFDNVPNGETTKHNTTSLTLNVRHKGYQARRRSRIFMVGVDEHTYSDYAIQWLLDELVDDGDEIVCVRVIEKDIRFNDKQYQDDAQDVMQNILSKNAANRAVSFVLEYAVGKLHATFQKLVRPTLYKEICRIENCTAVANCLLCCRFKCTSLLCSLWAREADRLAASRVLSITEILFPSTACSIRRCQLLLCAPRTSASRRRRRERTTLLAKHI